MRQPSGGLPRPAWLLGSAVPLVEGPPPTTGHHDGTVPLLVAPHRGPAEGPDLAPRLFGLGVEPRGVGIVSGNVQRHTRRAAGEGVGRAAIVELVEDDPGLPCPSGRGPPIRTPRVDVDAHGDASPSTGSWATAGTRARAAHGATLGGGRGRGQLSITAMTSPHSRLLRPLVSWATSSPASIRRTTSSAPFDRCTPPMR